MTRAARQGSWRATIWRWASRRRCARKTAPRASAPSTASAAACPATRRGWSGGRGAGGREGRLGRLVNRGGGGGAGRGVGQLELDVWEHMLDLNLRTAFLLAKHAARPMLGQRWGRILHLSSRGARTGRRNAAAYAVAKNAVLTLTEVQAEELRDANITVNAILPSIVDTPANRSAMPDADFSRWPKAEEIARVLLFLASEDAGLISGSSIPLYARG